MVKIIIIKKYINIGGFFFPHLRLLFFFFFTCPHKEREGGFELVTSAS